MVARRGSLSGYKRPRRGEAGAASRDKKNRRERVNMPLSEHSSPRISAYGPEYSRIGPDGAFNGRGEMVDDGSRGLRGLGESLTSASEAISTP